MSKKILIDEYVLSSEYIPSKLIFRENEYLQIVNNIRNNINTLLIGPVGSGKSNLVKLAIKELQREVQIQYVDCAIYDTQYSVLREILPKNELIIYKSVYELIKYLSKIIQQNKKRMIVCFDNFNRLKEPEIVKKFLNLGVNVLLIGNVEREDKILTENVISHIPSLLRLRNYSVEESLKIIKERARKALVPSSYTDTVLELIAKKTHGNITRALGILKFLCIQMEIEGKEVIDSNSEHLFHNPVNLTDDEQVLLRIIENAKKMSSSELYKNYSSYVLNAKGKRCFRKYMQNLRSLNLVNPVGNNSARTYQFTSQGCCQ